MRSISLLHRRSLFVLFKQGSSSTLRSRRALGYMLLCFGLVQTLRGQGLQFAPTINAVAGTNQNGYSGDGGLAISAQLGGPLSTVHDAGGNLYIADSGNSCVRMVAYGTGIITTIAGVGTAGFSGDGGYATNAELQYPRSVALDNAGNLYIADTGNNRVRAVNLASGVITTVAGTDTAGYNGDNILANAAQLNGPDGLVFDSTGNLYIADVSNYRVRMVVAGVITTVVGDGTAGFAGENVQATTAEINQVSRMAFDPTGNLYLADYGNQRVRMVTSGGVITTVAGTGTGGFSGDGGPALSAQLQGPADVAVDNTGDILILDSSNERIRLISAASNNITTIAGTGSVGDDNGPALTADFNLPMGIEFSNGTIYVADTTNNQVRAIATNPAPLPGTQVGSSVTRSVFLQVTGAPTSINSFAFAPSQGGSSEFTAGTVTGCAVDGSTPNVIGTICTVPVTFTPAYTGTRRLPLIAVTNGGTQNFGLTGLGLGSQVTVSPGTITSMAGTGTASYSGDTAAATSATLNAPQKSIVDSTGNVYVVDTANNAIRKITASTGAISTVAGNGAACSSAVSACGDGSVATSATLNGPAGAAVDAAGNLYIADTLDNRIREVNAATGVITTIAGSGAASYTGDGGAAAAATLNGPAGVAVDVAGNLYIADTANSAIREINAATGIISTLAGNGTICSSDPVSCGDGGSATAANLNLPAGIAVDASENVYIADTNDQSIREVTPANGFIDTIAGSGTAGYSGDGSAATNATLNAPSDVTVDSAGNLYIADSGNNVVRLVQAANGNIVTIAGTNAASCTDPTATCGDAGPSTGANLNTPGGVALDGAANLYITDTIDNRIREVNAASVSLNFASAPAGQTSSDSPQLVTLFSTGNSALNFPVPTSGTDPVISTGFTIDGSSTCPQFDSGSSAGQLASGAACTYAVDFAPTTEGAVAGTLAITDDSLNTIAPGYATQTVTLNGTGTARLPLATSNATPLFGQSVTFTDTIAPVNNVIPTGTVNFYNGSTLLGTSSLDVSGAATLSTTALPVGTDTVNAVYSGDSHYAQSTSNAVTETVGKAGGVETLTTSNASPTFGQSITLTDTIPTVNGTAPTGSVTFYNGFTQLGRGTVDGSGVATLATAGLPGGTDTVIAFYGGDANYSFVISNGITETVAKSFSPDTLTTSNASPSFGQSITLTDTIPTVGGVAATGTVTFYNGAAAIGTGTVNASGVSTLTTGSLSIGADSITAVYGGDGNYGQVTSNEVTETVSKTAGADTLTTSNGSPAFGQSITLTDTIPTVNSIAPTGTVTFYNGATVIGTGTVNASGVATVSTASLPAGPDSLTAAYGGDANYASVTAGPLTVTVGKYTATDTLTTSNASPNYGQSITLNDTLPTVGGVVPTGTVTFLSGTTALGTGTVTLSGVATLTTAALPVGADSVTATYGGDANYATATAGPLAETVGKAAAADTLTTSDASPSFGQSITVTDTIAVVNSVAPTGTVTFYNGVAAIGTGTVNASGAATLIIASLPAGSDSLTAVYPGDSTYAGGTAGPIVENISKSSSTDTLTTSNASPNLGQAVTFTDTVPILNGVAATGTVTFYDATIAIGTGTLNGSGQATVTISSLPAGSDAITAVYPGDGTYLSANAGPLTETVAKNSAADTLTASSLAPTVGVSVTFTDTIPLVAGFTPTGTVSFYNGTTMIGAGPVNASGVATFTTSTLPAGADSITAVYGGDSNDASVTAGPITVAVGKAGGADVLTSSNQSPTVGQYVTFTDTLPTLNGVIPTGTVTFLNGAATLGIGTVNASGIATLSAGSLGAGTDSITAVYAGDANYSSSTAGPLVETVGKASGADALMSSNQSPSVGQSVTFTDTLTVLNGITPTGTVTFYNGTLALGVGAVNASSVATLTTGSLPVGADSITAVYAGDGNYNAATAGPLLETVSKGSGGGALTSSNLTPTVSQAVTLTDTLPVVNAVVPTGTVIFYNSGTSIGTAAVNPSGAATITIASLPVGMDSITAVYSGDSNDNPATAGPVVETVSKAAGAAILTSSNPAPLFGVSVTLTDTIAVLNGVAPTGSVTFYNGAIAMGLGAVSASGVAAMATASLPAGSDVITAVYAGDGNYLSSTAGPVTEIVTAPAVQTKTVATLTASTNAATLGQSVTFTSSITLAGAVAPTGTVIFSNGTTALGTGEIDASGVATYTTTALPTGSDSITVSYAGDLNYGPASAGPVTVTVSPVATDFTISASSSYSSVVAGNASVVTLSLAGLHAAFTLPVTLSATGLPPGASVSFTPASVVPGAGPTTTQMTIQTAATQSTLSPFGSLPAGSFHRIAYGLLLLPLLGVRRFRSKLHAIPKAVTYVFALLAVLAAMGSMSGCSGGSIGVPARFYTITVTGSSNTLQHSTNVTLLVQ